MPVLAAAQLEERRQRLIRSFCTKGPVYENCRMLSHDGEPLSFIDHRKLSWYEVGYFGLFPHSLAVIRPVPLHASSAGSHARAYMWAHPLCSASSAVLTMRDVSGLASASLQACPNMLHCISNPFLKRGAQERIS